MSAEELPVVQEVRPQHLWDDEHPLRVADLLQHLIGQKRRDIAHGAGAKGYTSPEVDVISAKIY